MYVMLGLREITKYIALSLITNKIFLNMVIFVAKNHTYEI